MPARALRSSLGDPAHTIELSRGSYFLSRSLEGLADGVRLCPRVKWVLRLQFAKRSSGLSARIAIRRFPRACGPPLPAWPNWWPPTGERRRGPRRPGRVAPSPRLTSSSGAASPRWLGGLIARTRTGEPPSAGKDDRPSPLPGTHPHGRRRRDPVSAPALYDSLQARARAELRGALACLQGPCRLTRDPSASPDPWLSESQDGRAFSGLSRQFCANLHGGQAAAPAFRLSTPPA